MKTLSLSHSAKRTTKVTMIYEVDHPDIQEAIIISNTTPITQTESIPQSTYFDNTRQMHQHTHIQRPSLDNPITHSHNEDTVPELQQRSDSNSDDDDETAYISQFPNTHTRFVQKRTRAIEHQLLKIPHYPRTCASSATEYKHHP